MGETFITLHDLKLELIKSKTPDSKDINMNTLKAIDIQKLNEFAKQGLAMFTHFASFYSTNQTKPEDANIIKDNFKYTNMTLEQISSLACWTPDDSKYLI